MWHGNHLTGGDVEHSRVVIRNSLPEILLFYIKFQMYNSIKKTVVRYLKKYLDLKFLAKLQAKFSKLAELLQ